MIQYIKRSWTTRGYQGCKIKYMAFTCRFLLVFEHILHCAYNGVAHLQQQTGFLSSGPAQGDQNIPLLVFYHACQLMETSTCNLNFRKQYFFSIVFSAQVVYVLYVSCYTVIYRIPLCVLASVRRLCAISVKMPNFWLNGGSC